METINIPIVSALKLKEIHSIVETIITKKEQDKDTIPEEQQIDLMVYKLYELTYDEVLIVDPETPIGKEEYCVAQQTL